jgi:hypothetical protein
VSVSAIGYGRNAMGKISYSIHDANAATIEIRAIDGPVLPFDYVMR